MPCASVWIWLKEFQVLRTNYYIEFVLFAALVLLESHRDVTLRYLIEVRLSSLYDVPVPKQLVPNVSLTKRNDRTRLDPRTG